MMKTNTLSAFVLISVAGLSAGCMDISADPTNEMAESLVLEAELNANTANIQGSSSLYGSKLIIAPDEVPHGATYGDWAAAYWQWAMAIPLSQNPLVYGSCEENQSGGVFYLPSNMGGLSLRACKIPHNKKLFIPLLTTVAQTCPERAEDAAACPNNMSIDALANATQSTINNANPSIQLIVDGNKIQISDEFRVQSGAFADTSPVNGNERLFPTCSGPIEANICGIEEGGTRHVLTEGYFVMLRQLPQGMHRISVVVATDPNSTTLPYEVAYDVFITPDA